MNKDKLIREQLDAKFIAFHGMEKIVVPPNGWIYSIRQALKMSLRQLGKKMSITPQSVKEIEEREKNGSISLKGLRKIALVLDMHFIYGFMPKHSTLEEMIEQRALELARQIVKRTSLHMSLEDQENSHERIAKAIQEKAEEFKKEVPKILWD